MALPTIGQNTPGRALVRASNTRRGPVPLVLGVTGPRELPDEDRPAVARALACIFAELQERHPSTSIVLLSPLAGAGDRLVARVALACDVQVVVPLPAPARRYAAGFGSRAARAEFRELLARASRRYVLDDARGGARKGDRTHRAARDAWVGAYVARHCQVLIALWDGLPDPERREPASEMVRLKLEGDHGRCAVDRPLDPPDTGPVYHVLIPPRGAAGRRASAGQADVRRLYPGAPADIPRASRAYGEVLGQLELFNREAVGPGRPSEAQLARSAAGLIPPHERALLTDAATAILGRYALADAMARRFRRRHQNSLRGLLAFAFVWTCLYQVHVLSGVAGTWDGAAVVLYLIFLFAAVGLYAWATLPDDHNKFLDCRALAEGLRVQLFWTLCGLGERVEDHYLRRQRTELDWIRQAIRAGGIVDGLDGRRARKQGRVPEELALALVVERWADPQERYMQSKARSNDVVDGAIRAYGNASIAIFLALAILKVMMRADKLFAGLTLAVTTAGLLKFYSFKCALAEQAKQYRVMAETFRSFRRRLAAARAGEEPGFVSLVRALGKEALEENGDWVLLRRGRPPELPRS